jgi:hypothetical protein
MSPSGKRVALIDKACRTCERELRVLDVSGSAATPVLFIGVDDYRGRMGDFAWLDDTALMLAFRPAVEDAEYALWALDIDADKRFTLMVPQGDAQLVSPCASLDGSKVAAANPAAGSIVVLTRATNDVVSYDVGGRAGALSFSHDGGRLVFERTQVSSYHEIVLLDLASRKVTQLTDNASPDRFPQLSPDGKRVYFEARNNDPVFGRKRAVVRIAWVPTP